ncbi:MAG: carbohydrate transporter permease, partial [Bacillales bacterium]|nr:carbohydrate transporter permease [Bacillales bacterium]
MNNTNKQRSFNSTKLKHVVIFIALVLLSILFLSPIFIVLLNSFKGKFFISETPFLFPNKETYVGIANYVNGIRKVEFIKAFGYSVFITVFSVGTIILFTSMTGWYITRVKTKFTSILYYLFVFSMIVPFQMVMFTMSKTANMLHLDNPFG